MNQELLERIKMLLVEETGIELEELTPDTTLLGDVGITGDDAMEFLECFVEEFDVDMTGFEFLRHFDNEGVSCVGGLLAGLFFLSLFYPITWPLYFLIWKLGWWDPFGHGDKIPITLEDLVAAAESGRWLQNATPSVGAGRRPAEGPEG